MSTYAVINIRENVKYLGDHGRTLSIREPHLLCMKKQNTYGTYRLYNISQAIAELMCGLPGQDSNACNIKQERKINPLGKPNKKFLGRTINNALRHNKRAIERTQANCQQKLQELDYRHERRQQNVFYNPYLKEEFNRTMERKGRSRDKIKTRHSSRSSSREYRSRSRRYKKKHRKTKKSPTRLHRCRSPSSEPVQSPEVKNLSTARSDLVHSNNLALAMAMAYSRQLRQLPANRPLSSVSPSSEIVKEMMSDDETVKRDIQLDELSTASLNYEILEIVTIDGSSQDEQSVCSQRTDGECDSDNSKCINLTFVDSESDLEIIECNLETKDNRSPLSLALTKSLETADIAPIVDLTED